jgi:Putative transposase/Transposase zinc-binding domain
VDPCVYRPRRPAQTPLYQLLESLFETVKGAWEDLFQTRYGFWRAILDGVVARYLDCGIFERGFARIRCPGCATEFLLAFSCKGRGLCPSCGAKRAAEFAAFLQDQVVADVGHAQWVFTVPKMLRPYFMHHRELLGPLCTAAWQTVRELMAVAAGEEKGFRPGMVAMSQTFGDQLNPHPHVHALVTRGGWTASGQWVGVPYVDPSAAEQLFRHKVIRLLQRADLLDEDRTRLLLSWQHSGFSVHNAVTVPAGDGHALEALARYCLRNPVSLARLQWTPGSATAAYLPRPGHHDEKAETLDALDFLARLLAHVPDPRRHTVHYYGAYSNVVRGKLKARRQAQHTEPLAPGPGEAAPPPPASVSPSLAALRRGWAQLLRRVYEIEPLVCPRCQGVMRVVAFITDHRVIRRILDHVNASARRAPQDRASPPSAAVVVAPAFP